MDPNFAVLESVVERCRIEEEGYDCFREGRAHRLQIWGQLPRGWVGNLSLHLFASGLTILSGDALREGTEGAGWAASFLLRPEDPEATIRHDFLRMARRAPSAIPALPAPSISTSVRFSRSCPGTLHAHVRGSDSIGLLAELLRRFDLFGLQPRQFVLRSKGDEVRDWFWLEPTAPR